jgi:hypothetical protein
MADLEHSNSTRLFVPSPHDDPEFTHESDLQKPRTDAAANSDVTRTPFFVAFSILMGILGPIFCVTVYEVAMPELRFESPGFRIMSLYGLFSYGVIGMEIVVLALWLVLAERLGTGCGFISGVLFTGSLFAGAIGLVLLPLTLMGLCFGIGLLGLVPLFTALVFYFHSARAYRWMKLLKGGERPLIAPLLGMTLALGLPGSIQIGASLVVRSAMRDIADGNPAGVARLRHWVPIAYRDRMLISYLTETHPVRRARLASAFKTLTGEDPESMAWRFND